MLCSRRQLTEVMMWVPYGVGVGSGIGEAGGCSGELLRLGDRQSGSGWLDGDSAGCRVHRDIGASLLRGIGICYGCHRGLQRFVSWIRRGVETFSRNCAVLRATAGRSIHLPLHSGVGTSRDNRFELLCATSRESHADGRYRDGNLGWRITRSAGAPSCSRVLPSSAAASQD